MILETERLYLREMTQVDFPLLCKHLQDPEVMYAYEHAYSDAEVQEGIDKQLQRYKNDGFGVWAVILKENEILIGQCGLTLFQELLHLHKAAWKVRIAQLIFRFL